MKSEPARPAIGFTSVVTPASAAICRAVGRSTEGIFPAAAGGAAFTLLVTAVAAAPVTATPARNFRRFTSRLVSSERGFLRAIVCPYSPSQRCCNALCDLGGSTRSLSGDLALIIRRASFVCSQHHECRSSQAVAKRH